MTSLRLGPAGLVVTAVLLVSCSATASVPPTSRSSGTPSESLGWQDTLTTGTDKLDVATTVAPISSIARNIGGTHIRLHGIIPDAVNSHTFEPAPSDAETLANADLIIVNGLHLEEPTLDLAEASKRNDAEIKLLADNTITRDQWIFDFSFPASEGDPNPHLWMNVRYARHYAELMRDWFSAADPAHADAYAGNATRYLAALDALDAAIRAETPTVPAANRKLLTYHDSWAYWAREYGFTVIGAVQASDFSDPSPQDVAALIEQIRSEHVPAVFGSEVFPSDVLEQIARESGAKFIDKLRDDEPPGDQHAPEHTYLGMMQRDMEIMFEALGGKTDAFQALAITDTYAP